MKSSVLFSSLVAGLLREQRQRSRRGQRDHRESLSRRRHSRPTRIITIPSVMRSPPTRPPSARTVTPTRAISGMNETVCRRIRSTRHTTCGTVTDTASRRTAVHTTSIRCLTAARPCTVPWRTTVFRSRIKNGSHVTTGTTTRATSITGSCARQKVAGALSRMNARSGRRQNRSGHVADARDRSNGGVRRGLNGV